MLGQAEQGTRHENKTNSGMDAVACVTDDRPNLTNFCDPFTLSGIFEGSGDASCDVNDAPTGDSRQTTPQSYSGRSCLFVS